MNKVVVFCPNLIGDTVMATPAIRALRRGYPNAALIGVVKSNVAPTLDGTPWFDSVIPFNLKSSDPELRTRRVLKQLKQERADLAVLFPNSFRSALMAWRAGITRRIGYARGGRRLLLTDRLEVPKDGEGKKLPVPAVEYYLAIVRQLGLHVDSVRVELATTPSDESSADQAWARLGLNTGRRVVILNTGGAFGTKACIKRSALMITTDSGPRHFAAAFGVPVISLFGPTHIAWTRTNHPNAVHLSHPVPCGPCQKPTCALGHHRCMTELKPAAVYDVAARMLGRPAATYSPHFGRILRVDGRKTPTSGG